MLFSGATTYDVPVLSLFCYSDACLAVSYFRYIGAQWFLPTTSILSVPFRDWQLQPILSLVGSLTFQYVLYRVQVLASVLGLGGLTAVIVLPFCLVFHFVRSIQIPTIPGLCFPYPMWYGFPHILGAGFVRWIVYGS